MALEMRRKNKLLAELSELTHSQRIRHISEFGRDHAGTKELRDLLDSLDGDLHEWQLRLYAAHAGRESSDIVEALASPSRSVCSLAMFLLRTSEIDLTAIMETVADMPAHTRRALLSVIKRRGDETVADGLIAEVHDRFGAEEASVILPACSAPVATETLPLVAHAMSSWPSFVRSHPSIFNEFLREQMSMAPIVRKAWWTRAAAGISELIDVDPAAALNLWADFGRGRAIPAPITQKLPRLATEDINRTLNLLLETQTRKQLAKPMVRLRRRLASADDQVLIRLCQELVHHDQLLASVLAAVAPSRRAGLFDQALVGIDTSQISWDRTLLRALPHRLRHSETERMLQLSHFRDAGERRHDLTIWLPIEQSWETLRSATHANDAELRAAAYRRLVSAVVASGDPGYVDQLFVALRRLRNEQDPVRAQALRALSRCPTRLITLDHMALIDELVDFALEARDSSQHTVGALTSLLQRILANSATAESTSLLERCVAALSLVAGQSGHLQLGRLYQNLPKNGEFVLHEALAPQIRSDLAAGRPQLLFSLVDALGPRAHAVPQIADYLEEVTRSKSSEHATQAIRMWLAAPRNRGYKLGKLIAHDPSTVLIDPVFRMLSLARQDLLDTALSEPALSGRFAPSRNRKIPLINNGFHRWLPGQRSAYAALLNAAAHNEYKGHVRVKTIRSLSRIPEIGTNYVRAFVSSDDVLAIESALAGLAWSESPAQELTTLLSYANTDRARVAIYAATRAARFSRPQALDSAISELLAADDSKLTSRKAALRILSQNRTPGAIGVFAALWGQRPLHRSIEIALAASLRTYPEMDLTWEVYSALAAGDGDAAYAIVSSMDPLSWPPERRTQLANATAPLVEHEAAAVRDAAWAKLAMLRPWSEQVRGLVSNAVVDLSTIVSWRPATVELRRLLDGFPGDPLLADTVRRLAEQPIPENVASTADRDVPVRQRLEDISRATPNSGEGRATMRLAGEHLVDAGFPVEAVTFITNGMEWSEPETTIRRLVRLGDQHPAAAPQLGRSTIDMLTRGAAGGVFQPDALLPIGTELATGSEAAGLVGCAIAQIAGHQAGWAKPWRDLLAVLRQHDSVWVQHHAFTIRTSKE